MTSSQNRSELFRDLQQRADKGDFNACAKIGHVYAVGDTVLGIEQDIPLAIQYYERGANAGDLLCTFGLAGVTLPQDAAKGLALLQKCADQKYVWALAMLGDFYLRGKYVPKDKEKAFTYLKEYNELCRPDTVAVSTLKVRWDLVLYPLCLFFGVGCEKDEHKAHAVFETLAAFGNINACDILNTGKLSDWMVAKRFDFDTKATGPVTLFDPATKPQRTPAANVQVHNKQPDAVIKSDLSAALQQALIPGEDILMQGHFPRIYTVDSFLRLFAFLALGVYAKYLLFAHNVDLNAVLPEPVYLAIYQHPNVLLYLCSAYGFLVFLSRMVRKWTTEILLTDRRFIYKRGLFSVEMLQMNFWQIEHSDVSQSIIGSMLDFGSVYVQSYAIQRQETQSSGVGMVILPPISHPFLFTRLIEDNRRIPRMNGASQRSPHGA